MVDLFDPMLLDTTLEAGYQSMAADQMRESEAMAWCEGLIRPKNAKYQVILPTVGRFTWKTPV